MIKLRNILIFVLILISQVGLTQELTAKAHAMFKAGDYDSARVFIDQAVLTPEKNNSQTWQLRGLIYHKLETPPTINLTYRDIALESYLQARKTDSTGIYKDQITKYLANTIVRYYNDAVTYLDENKFVESERTYLIYKEKYILLIDPAKQFSALDIEYYNALGNGYSRQLGRLSGKDYEITFTLAVNALSKVLAIDSMNYLANLNTAVLYYNRGADLVENPDVNGSMEQLIANIELSNELFLKALPMMQKAYLLNPESPEVIEGLAGIYYSLNDNENWTIYQTKLDIINLPKYLEEYEKDPTNKDVLKQLVRIYSSTLKDEAQHLKFKTILDQLGG